MAKWPNAPSLPGSSLSTYDLNEKNRFLTQSAAGLRFFVMSSVGKSRGALERRFSERGQYEQSTKKSDTLPTRPHEPRLPPLSRRHTRLGRYTQRDQRDSLIVRLLRHSRFRFH